MSYPRADIWKRPMMPVEGWWELKALSVMHRKSFRTSFCCTMNLASTSPRPPVSMCRPDIFGIFDLDGKERKLIVEGVGGPSWFTEFNMLTGLSVRSFGRFATSVTRIAAGRVYRGLP